MVIMYKVSGINLAENKTAIIESLEKLPEINAAHVILNPAKILLFLNKKIETEKLDNAIKNIGKYSLNLIEA